jgi:hypothetical protein
MACTELFWHTFYTGAGITLAVLLPFILGLGTPLVTIFRQQHRHEAALQEARRREYQARGAPYRVIQGGQE